MQQKSTLAAIRDLPNYPQIVSRVVAVIHLFLGLGQAVPSALLFYRMFGPKDQSSSSSGGVQLSDDLQNALVTTVIFYGGLFLLLGLASLWVAYGNLTARPSIWLTTIWVTALHVAGWVSGTTEVASALLYLLIILGAAAVVLYLFDPRIKAYFGRGKLALQYAEWASEKYLGRTNVASPWDYEVKPKKPLLGDKPL